MNSIGKKLHVLAVIGTLHRQSVTGAVTRTVIEHLEKQGCSVDLLDFRAEPLPLYDPETVYTAPHYGGLKQRVEAADAFLLGTPDYHGSVSSTLKNFLDHFWHEFAGKLFATLVASHEKGLTVTDQLRTVARQCYAWTLPYGVSFVEDLDVKEGAVINEGLSKRLEMMARDIRVYGDLLAEQRRRDLAGSESGFMARWRK